MEKEVDNPRSLTATNRSNTITVGLDRLPKPPIPLKTEANVSPLPRQWNTKNLQWRLGSDVAAAASAGILVAPIITMIDKGIIENASGRNTLGASLKASLLQLFTRPHRFVFSKPFALIFSLYTGTYMMANVCDTVSSTIQSKPATTTSSGAAKFISTSSVNLGLCLYKDSRFTQLFSASNSTPKRVPIPTYALFTIRDCLTVFASFNLPPLLAPRLSNVLSAETQKSIDSTTAAQFIAPAAMQIVSTPLHLLGLDLYNRSNVQWSSRTQKILRDWTKSCLARMARIVPAFGVGGVVNMRARKNLIESL